MGGGLGSRWTGARGVSPAGEWGGVGVVGRGVVVSSGERETDKQRDRDRDRDSEKATDSTRAKA